MSNRRMEDNLTQGLRELARETRGQAAPPAVGPALLAELREQRRAVAPERLGTHLRWWRAAVAAVLLIGIGFGFARWSRHEPVQTPVQTVVLLPAQPGTAQAPAVTVAPSPGTIVTAAPEIEASTAGAGSVRPAARRTSRQAVAQKPERWSDTGAVKAVTPWFYNTGLPAANQGQVLRLEVTAATAARFGVAATGPVQAEIFIADDGLTRAIRFVQ